MGKHGAKPHTPLHGKNRMAREESLRISGIKVRKVKGGFEHGAKPHTPLHGKNGMAREESLRISGIKVRKVKGCF